MRMRYGNVNRVARKQNSALDPISHDSNMRLWPSSEYYSPSINHATKKKL